MKPLTQKVLLAALAVVSIGTTGLILLRGAIENASYESQIYSADAASDDHAHHHDAAAIVQDTHSSMAEDFGPAPAFTMIDQTASPVTLDTFKGKVVIADFIFTRCPGPCPLISTQMKHLQATLQARADKSRIALVSFSVDPVYDTPPVLTDYAKQYEADPAMWTFLTGDKDAMWHLIGKDGFRLAVMAQPNDSVSPILHTTKLVLIGPDGHIRGYFDALDPESRQRMLTHLDQILASADAARPVPAGVAQ